MKNLAATLTYLMSQKNIKSAELARKTGVGQPVIHRLMTGVTENPQVLTIKPIADYFGVTLDQLFGLSAVSSQVMIDNASIHELNTKLTTIKMISSVLADLIPTLTDGYKIAADANIVDATISPDILPLLPLNIANLLKTINQLQEILTANPATRD